MKQKLALLKLLADETRLNILNILLREDSYVEKIACDLSLTPATICYHLKSWRRQVWSTARARSFT